jgi:hypothetical protein
MAMKMRRSGPAKSVSKQVAQILNSRVEHKLATSLTPSFIDWTTAGVVSELSTDVAQGDNIGNRSGDVIRPLNLSFTLQTRCYAASTSNCFRVILFQDTMSSGAAPAVTDILNSASNISKYKPVNWQAKRFKILADFNGTNVGVVDNQETVYTKNIKMRGMVHYVNTATGAASAGKNTIYALFISSAATTISISYKWSYLLEYIDA